MTASRLSDPAAERYLDPRAERSRAALRAALVELLAGAPVEKLTILALTERAGIGYATFFRNYRDIDALLVDLAGNLITQLAVLLNFDRDIADTRNIASTIAKFALKKRVALMPLFIGASEALERKIVEAATAVALDRSTVSAASIPADLASRHAVRAVLNVLSWWLAQECPAPPEDVAMLIDRLAFQPLAVP